MPETSFLIFSIFLIFFSEFSSWVDSEWNSGPKFFSLFLGLSHPVLAKNNAGKRFFCFVIFFLFFWNFLARDGYERNSGRKFFFFSFLADLIPFWLKIMPESGFLIFWIFLLFFSEFSCRGWVWTEFGTKIFLSLSPLISSLFR